MDTAHVEVKSAWASKINWTQGIAFLALLLTYFGISMPPEVQAAICVAIGAGSQVATWVIRTWFTKSVTASSVTPGSRP